MIYSTNARSVADEIHYDIESGVYKNHKKLERRLVYVAERLYLIAFSETAELTMGDIELLKENDYI